MLKVQYNYFEARPYFNEILKMEKLLFTTTLREIYKFDHALKFIMIFKNDELVGYTVYKDRDISYDIYQIAVLKHMQKKNIATSMLEDLFDKDIILEVNSINTSAIKLYEKNNFIKFDTLHGYYDGVDGFKMIRKYDEN